MLSRGRDALGEDIRRPRHLLALLRALLARGKLGPDWWPPAVRRRLVFHGRGAALLLQAPAHRHRGAPGAGKRTGVRRPDGRVRARGPALARGPGAYEQCLATAAGRVEHKRPGECSALAVGLPRDEGCWQVAAGGPPQVRGPLRHAHRLAPQRPAWPRGALPDGDRARARVRLCLLGVRRRLHPGEVHSLLQSEGSPPLCEQPRRAPGLVAVQLQGTPRRSGDWRRTSGQ
mmetsp:Transcript_45020/g.90885  ORF Transcript_45020/g.90885 Transcript_45020/m.90885 type:complete len:231 (+) Transcript_45020:216-908(+)